MPLSEHTERIVSQVFSRGEGAVEKLFMRYDTGMSIVIASEAPVENTKILAVNPAFCDLTGYTPRELIIDGMSYRDLIPEDEFNYIVEYKIPLMGLTTGGFTMQEARLIRKDGRLLWVQARIFRVTDERSLVELWDISKMKAMEQELLRHMKIVKKQLPDTITPTECRVLEMVAEGKTTKEIAKTLSISPKTVDNHRYNCRKKLGIEPAANMQYELKNFYSFGMLGDYNKGGAVGA